MVRKLALFFGYSAFFMIMLLYFLPKVSLYYFGEEKLKPFGVVLSGEKLHDKGLSLEVDDMTIFVKSIESAKITSTNLSVFILYNSLDMEGVKLSKTLKAFVPLYIEQIQLSHSVFSPTMIYGKVNGAFGEARIEFNIVQKVLHVDLQPSQQMLKNYRTTLKEFTKNQDGGYSYDANL